MEGFGGEFGDLSQRIAEAIAAVLGIDVTVMDRARMRIAGTGRYKALRFKPIGEKSAFVRCFETGEVCVVEEAGKSPVCLDCAEAHGCAERAEICVPIGGADGPLGVIGVIAFDEEQRRTLVGHKENYLNFIQKMASLLEAKYAERRLTARLSSVLDSMSQAVFVFGGDGSVLYRNHKVEELLSTVGVTEREKFPAWLWGFVRSGAAGSEHAEAVYTEGERHFSFLCDVARLGSGDGEEYLVSLSDYNNLSMRIMRRSGSEALLSFDAILSVSSAMDAVKEMTMTAAASGSNILLTGESGTGKEVFARAIHNGSPQREKPFVAINCGAIPDGLLESELFGYEKGAFTGAAGTKLGKLEIADGGTLFLDEVGELPLHLQVKLLRALQEKEFCRLGSNVNRRVDLRVISATNADLASLMGLGRFREDLYYRLNIIPIRLPPLRERRGDVAFLTASFIRQFNEQFGKEVRGLTDGAKRLFDAYTWPGNVRELQNVLEFAVCMTRGEEIGESLVAQRLGLDSGACAACAAAAPDCASLKSMERAALEECERRYAHLGHKAMVDRVCAELGISRATYYRKRKSQNETAESK
ncbi:MAG: hypothetical protein EOM52_02375 [Clostridia bacterium]|nr:hypothetical protein [Clostridia bacterium]